MCCLPARVSRGLGFSDRLSGRIKRVSISVLVSFVTLVITLVFAALECNHFTVKSMIMHCLLYDHKFLAKGKAF